MSGNDIHYAVIIRNPKTGDEQVATCGLDGEPMTTSISVEMMIQSFKECFPHYEYRWSLIRNKATVMDRVFSWSVTDLEDVCDGECRETNQAVCAERKRVRP